MDTYRWVKGLGIRPVLCGNIKGLHDPYRNPTTQEGFARRWGMKARWSRFADGTKISFENAIVANATGHAGRQAPGCTVPSVEASTTQSRKRSTGTRSTTSRGPDIVDYVSELCQTQAYSYLGQQMIRSRRTTYRYPEGAASVTLLHSPYHLCHFEVPFTIARAVIFGDAAITPLGAPHVDVVAAAKKDLKAGEVLDGLGQYMTYGLCENAQVVHAERLLPIGLAEGCRLRRNVTRDRVLGYNDVEIPGDRLCDALRREQDASFRQPVIHTP